MTIIHDPLGGTTLQEAVKQAIDMKLAAPYRDIELKFNGIIIHVDLEKCMMQVYADGMAAQYCRCQHEEDMQQGASR